jgi:hypothetical protein
MTPSTVMQPHGLTGSGLEVVVETLAWARSCAASLVVGCGSRDDPPGREGTAHLVEHLRGLPRQTGGAVGVPLLASTEADRTCYDADGDPDALGPLIARLYATVTDPAVPVSPAVFEGERQAVLLETRRMDQRPMLRVGPILAAAAAREPGLDAVARTTVESVCRVTPEDVESLVERAYQPRNARLFVAGPPGILPAVAATLGRDHPTAADPTLGADHPTAASAELAPPPASPLDSVPGLDDLVAVTLVRPATADTPLLDALVSPAGPLLSGPARSMLRGRTTVLGRSQRVDVTVWQPAAAEALRERLADLAGAAWCTPAALVAQRLATRWTNERGLADATPLRRVRRAARQAALPGPHHPEIRLALWQLSQGVPRCLTTHDLAPPRATAVTQDGLSPTSAGRVTDRRDGTV